MFQKLPLIKEIAQRPDWKDIRANCRVEIKISSRSVVVELAKQKTKIGHLYFWLCPKCRARRKFLWWNLDNGEIGCRGAGCLRILYPDQQLSNSPINKKVVIPSRQIRRVEARLAQRGLDKNGRRILHRRKKKLLRQMEQALAEREEKIKQDINKMIAIL